MRRRRVVFSAEAAADIDDVFAYVLDRSGDSETAFQYTDRIYRRCQKIGDAPLGGVAREDLAPGLRITPFERRAAIAFRLEADVVVIVNVFHGGRDYEALFRDGP